MEIIVITVEITPNQMASLTSSVIPPSSLECEGLVTAADSVVTSVGDALVEASLGSGWWISV